MDQAMLHLRDRPRQKIRSRPWHTEIEGSKFVAEPDDIEIRRHLALGDTCGGGSQF